MFWEEVSRRIAGDSLKAVFMVVSEPRREFFDGLGDALREVR